MICPIDAERLCPYEVPLEGGDMTCEECEVLAVNRQPESQWRAHYLNRFKEVR